eukprot:1146185-Pelagomonas_calceolata.AAC.1
MILLSLLFSPSSWFELNWTVLRECGRKPLQLPWFYAALEFYNALLRSNSTMLCKVLRADVEMSSLCRKCWTSEFWLLARA